MPRALIIDPDRHAADVLRTMLEDIGMKVDVHPHATRSIADALRSSTSDIIFIALPSDLAAAMELMREIKSAHRTRIILTGSSIEPDVIREASGGEVAYFLGKPFRRHDVIAGMELAVAHAEQVEGYREEVSRLKDLLEQRKVVERAKGILMEKRGMSESEAYRLIQTAAMKRRLTIRDVAERILRGVFP